MFEADAFFAALADPTRRRILALLHQGGERCVCTLYETLDLAQPKVSRHLGVLRAAGVVATRREGLWVHYRIHPDLPDWARAVITVLDEGLARPSERAAGGGSCRVPAASRRPDPRRGQRAGR